MANFIIREGRQRIPENNRDPHRKHAERQAARMAKNLKFESPGQESDYRRKIMANPRNIYGGPEFFPPVEIKEFVVSSGLSEAERLQQLDEKRRRLGSGIIPMRCADCIPLSHRNRPDKNGVTPHWMSYDTCKCQFCGKEKPFRTKNIQTYAETATSCA